MKTNIKRVGFYLILNILVSAITTWVVVSLLLNNGVLPSLGSDNLSNDGVNTPIYDPLLAELIVSDVVKISNLIGAGDISNEYVEIEHIGDEELSMEGWQLVDEQNNIFNFPGLTLHSGGVVRVYTKAGPLSAIELYWGLDGSVWNSGERVVLLDAEGEAKASLIVP